MSLLSSFFVILAALGTVANALPTQDGDFGEKQRPSMSFCVTESYRVQKGLLGRGKTFGFKEAISYRRCDLVQGTGICR